MAAEGDIKTLADLDEVLTICAPWVRQYQLQVTDVCVTLLYVMSASNDAVDMSMVYASLRHWFGHQRMVELLAVPSIAPESSGKFAIVK